MTTPRGGTPDGAMRLGTCTRASSPMRVRGDDSATEYIVSYRFGSVAPAVGDRVLWTVIGGLIVAGGVTAV